MNNGLLIDGLPKFYNVHIKHVTGASSQLEIVQHAITQNGLLEIITSDDRIILVPISNVQSIEFDRLFSKIVHMRKEQLEKQNMSQGG